MPTGWSQELIIASQIYFSIKHSLFVKQGQKNVVTFVVLILSRIHSDSASSKM